MSADHTARLRETEVRNETPSTEQTQRREGLRHHVINRLAMERSGRLYSPFDLDFEIPSLEIYAAR